MKRSLALLLLIPFTAHAGLNDMMRIYKSPQLAPKIAACRGDQYCNGFIALSKQWKEIPNSYRYKGKYDIKATAREGVTYDNNGRNIGLYSGFYFSKERSQKFIDGVEKYKNNLIMIVF